MKKFLTIFLALVFTTNCAMAAGYGCCKVYNIKRNGKPYKTFKSCNKNKKSFERKAGNMGIYRGLDGQIGTYKQKGKRLVAYDMDGHRMSYCRIEDGKFIRYDKSGRPDGYCY
jgi:uncharacterized protein YigE (DUF2233 family)